MPGPRQLLFLYGAGILLGVVLLLNGLVVGLQALQKDCPGGSDAALCEGFKQIDAAIGWAIALLSLIAFGAARKLASRPRPAWGILLVAGALACMAGGTLVYDVLTHAKYGEFELGPTEPLLAYGLAAAGAIVVVAAALPSTWRYAFSDVVATRAV